MGDPCMVRARVWGSEGLGGKKEASSKPQRQEPIKAGSRRLGEMKAVWQLARKSHQDFKLRNDISPQKAAAIWPADLQRHSVPKVRGKEPQKP